MHYEEKKKHIDPEQPLVSVITPLYNAEKFISQTIESVLAQTYQNWEHIIVDDCSTDQSVQWVKNYAEKDPRIRWVISEENKGAAVCRNEATQLAKGRFIAFLDSDDLWLPKKLETQINFMIKQNCGVSFTSYIHINEEGKSLNKRIKALKEVPFQKQHRNNYIGNLTGIYDIEKVGKIIAPNIRKRQDWAVWLEAIRKSGKPALGIQEDLAQYRVREGSISSNKWKLIQFNFRFYRDYLGYSWFKSVRCLLGFFWEYFVNRPKQIERL